jgi:hypothetical protein
MYHPVHSGLSLCAAEPSTSTTRIDTHIAIINCEKKSFIKVKGMGPEARLLGLSPNSITLGTELNPQTFIFSS